jgi:hypothetical protein
MQCPFLAPKAPSLTNACGYKYVHEQAE